MVVPTVQQFKPFDQKNETSETKKLIEAKYKILSEAIYKKDYESVDPILHSDLTVINAMYGQYDDDSMQDESSYLGDIEEGTPIASATEGNIPPDAKIERKITEFITGRRMSVAHYIEKSNGEFVDEDGEYGGKGKKVKVETEVVFTDHWFLTDQEDSETPDWYLYDREVTSFSFKINGKQFEFPAGDGTESHLLPIKVR